MTRTREWLLLNAVESWLHHYGTPHTETVAQYKKLRDEFHDTFMASIQPKDADTTTPRKRTNAKSSTKTV